MFWKRCMFWERCMFSERCRFCERCNYNLSVQNFFTFEPVVPPYKSATYKIKKFQRYTKPKRSACRKIDTLQKVATFQCQKSNRFN